jgi:hypothetical protein
MMMGMRASTKALFVRNNGFYGAIRTADIVERISWMLLISPWIARRFGPVLLLLSNERKLTPFDRERLI